MVAGKKPATGEIKCVMMAFDGSIHAARALSIVLELAAGSSVECILTTVASSLEAGQEILAPAETYLCNHGVIPIKKIIAGARASEQLCGIVAASEVDILVMGAYGHSPIREVFFGSTTERILSHCDATVILQS
jgi:nucleotide-binding universal stress UspA family protein